MPITPVHSSTYKVSNTPKGDVVIAFDDPNIKDEECTYTFRKDGSAERVSNAWGTKTELPAGTFVEDGKKLTPEQMRNLYDSYYMYRMNKSDK